MLPYHTKTKRNEHCFSTIRYASLKFVFSLCVYFKIKQIQLGYSFPKQLIKKVAIENLRIYGSLEDFFTFTDYPGFDPEVTGVGNSLGVDKGSYPNSKKVVLGLSVTF